jgi:aspartate-semialdehyde dehydrogenase
MTPHSAAQDDIRNKTPAIRHGRVKERDPLMAKIAKIPVGILGATGMVGQRFIQLLERHPWFEVAWVAASERSYGKTYAEAAKWKMKTPIPARVANMILSAAEPNDAPKVIFAALDSDIAREMEPAFAEAGCAVISNSSAFRMHPNVPLVIPEINADHIKLIDTQSWRRNSGGFMVTNSNCSVMGLAIALAPLQKAFGIEAVLAVTMQAVSGAGYPGVASMDILGNVVPYIKNEEEKMQEEAGKLLGKLKGREIIPASFVLSAHCNRVAVEDGHTESISIKLKKRATPEKIIAAWREYRGMVADLKLPFAPADPIFYDERPDRPQPRLDIERGHGMTVSCGRLRPCTLLDWKFTMLSHNTIRGAAGAALLNAELLKAKGYLD